MTSHDTAKLLAGKVALVTGAGRGLGRAFAEKLAALGADEAQPFLQAVAIGIARRRRKAALGLQVGDVLQHRCAFRQPLAVVQHEDRHSALRRNAAKIAVVVRDRLGREMHQMIARIEAGFHQRDAARKRAGHRREIELQHRVAPLRQRIAARDDREAVG